MAASGWAELQSWAGQARLCSFLRALEQYIHGWGSRPTYSVVFTHFSPLGIRFKGSRKDEILGIANNRLIRIDLAVGDVVKTWRFSNMRQWNVNWDIRQVGPKGGQGQGQPSTLTQPGRGRGCRSLALPTGPVLTSCRWPLSLMNTSMWPSAVCLPAAGSCTSTSGATFSCPLESGPAGRSWMRICSCSLQAATRPSEGSPGCPDHLRGPSKPTPT